MAVLLAEGFYGGFVIEQRRDYVPVFGVSLLAYHHEIAVADGCVHHGIPVDFEHEEITRAGEPFREPHDIFDVLLGGNRSACCNPAHKGHVARLKNGFLIVRGCCRRGEGKNLRGLLMYGFGRN